MIKAPLYAEIAEAPNYGSAYWINSGDNIRLRIGHWQSDATHKGTVIIFPGRSEYIEKYGRTVSDFIGRGYATIVVDWRGQGLADRLTIDPMTGHVLRFSDYHNDVEAVTATLHLLDLPKPWYLVGHSLGACIGLRAIVDGLPVSACAFTSPMWDIKLPKAKRFAAWPLSWLAQAIGKGDMYAVGTSGESYVRSTPFGENRLTNDPEMYDYFLRQANSLLDHQIGGPSMGWIFQILKETRSLSKLNSPDIPCITFYGDDDELVAIPAIRNRMIRWPSGGLEIIHNAKHDIFSEILEVRSDVINKICCLFEDNVERSK